MDHDEPGHSAEAPAGDPQPWRTERSRLVYANPWLSLREDMVRRPDGSRGVYGVVTTGPCVGMLPFTTPHRVLLVRQWRYVTNQLTWEMPTGGMHPGESPAEAAQRELAEEAGVAGTLVPIGGIVSSKSVLDEFCHLFLARDLVPASAVGDETEDLRVREFPFAEVVTMVQRGEIVDAMTVTAVLWALAGDGDGGLRGPS